MTAAIATRDLRKSYGDLVAVDGIDLEVAAGEFFGMLGPNGAGKTTTIGMLTTRVVPTGGEARVFGLDVRAQPARAKRLIGVVPQTNTLDRSISVAENLYYHGRYFGMARRESQERTAALLERFSLREKADVMVDTLSGGMAQRLMVARALMHRPAVIFLDEPTTGLDPQSRIALWDLLTELNAEGQTILLTTHYMEEAERLCDRVAILDHGRVLALGTSDELVRQVAADTVVHLSADHPAGELHGLAEACLGEEAVTRADVHDRTVRVHVARSGGVLPRLVSLAEVEGVRLSDVRVSEPTLETVFIALTGRDLRE